MSPDAGPPGTGGLRSRSHVIAFDLIRLLVIGLVVGVHTLSVGSGTVTGLLGAFITVFHTSRELFFLLTAFVLTYNYGRRPRIKWLAFWRRRYRLVIPAYVAWTLIYFLADGNQWDAVGVLWRDLLGGSARYQLYFLLVTMQVYALFPLVRWLLRRTSGHHGVLFAVLWVYQITLTLAVQENWPAPGFIGSWLRHPTLWLPSYALYVVGGALAGWHFERLAAFTRRHVRVAGLVAVAGLCVGVGTYCLEWLVSGESPNSASAVFSPWSLWKRWPTGGDCWPSDCGGPTQARRGGWRRPAPTARLASTSRTRSCCRDCCCSLSTQGS